jgi:hypothetical protein
MNNKNETSFAYHTRIGVNCLLESLATDKPNDLRSAIERFNWASDAAHTDAEHRVAAALWDTAERISRRYPSFWNSTDAWAAESHHNTWPPQGC